MPNKNNKNKSKPAAKPNTKPKQAAKPKTKPEAKSKNKAVNKPYKHPIPSRNELLEFLTEAGKPLKTDAVLAGFELKGQRMRGLLVERLVKMVQAGQIL